MKLNLEAFRCRGFGEHFDRAMADVPVRGIDREQTHGMIRLSEETEPILYGREFSARRIRYRKGSRPVLEEISRGVASACTHAHNECIEQDTGEATRPCHPQSLAFEVIKWVRAHVVHSHFTGPLASDRAMTEEELIASGRGWCNEQVRVFVALCEVMEIPARICFLFHANGKTAHTAAEVLLDNRWAFHDVTYGVRVKLVDGRIAEARELQGKFRALAHAAYHGPMIEYHEKRYNREAGPLCDWQTGGDLLHQIGITNYLIEGVERVDV